MNPIFTPLVKKLFDPVCVFLLGCLVFVGCSGCGQKTAPQTPTPEPLPTATPPAETPSPRTPPQTPTARSQAATENTTPADVANKVIKLYESPQFKGVLRPWHPVVVPPHVKERIEERIEVEARPQEAGRISGNQYYQTNSAYREDVYRIYVEELGRIPTIRKFRNSIHRKKAEADLEQAYMDNPDDFQTLLTWAVYGGGGPMVNPFYGKKKKDAYRRLYEMDPTHPYVLHHLAIALYSTDPQEALGYALEAQHLEPHYIPRGVDGLCYAQLGDYEKALAVFKRAHAAAPEWLKPATIKRVNRIQQITRSEKLLSICQKAREAGEPVMWPQLLVRH